MCRCPGEASYDYRMNGELWWTGYRLYVDDGRTLFFDRNEQIVSARYGTHDEIPADQLSRMVAELGVTAETFKRLRNVQLDRIIAWNNQEIERLTAKLIGFQQVRLAA